MERKFIVIDEKSLECSIPVELGNTQEAILECKELREKIDLIAKNLQVCWDVKKHNNKSWAIISKVIDVTSLDKQAHDVEMKAISFMNAISELTLPVFEENCPTHEPANEKAEVLAKEIEFVKELKENECIIGYACIMPKGMSSLLTHLFCSYYNVSHATLMHMIDAYLEKYGHE